MTTAEKQRGFTLIELLVVVAIIGLLASIVIASLNSARLKGRDARRVSDLKQLQNALELYNDASSTYPSTTQPTVSAAVLATYIAALPKDPATQRSYAYAPLAGTAVSGCGGYHLGAVFENTSSSGWNSRAAATSSTICPGTTNVIYGDGASGSNVDFLAGSALCNATAGTAACYDVKM